MPGKNLRKVGGLSLVGFKARSARRSKHCARLIISSDSPEIIAEARRHGADAPFVRPAALATDVASSAGVVDHAMRWIERHTREQYDAVMLLEPSSPFARAADYDGAVDLMVARRAQVVVGVRPVAVNSTFVGPLDPEGRLGAVVRKIRRLRASRRQDLPQEYTMNGALYLFRWSHFRRHRAIYVDPARTYAWIMDEFHSLEIDSLHDLRYAEFLVERGDVDLTEWMA